MNAGEVGAVGVDRFAGLREASREQSLIGGQGQWRIQGRAMGAMAPLSAEPTKCRPRRCTRGISGISDI